MNAKNYGLAATLKTLRAIFENNQEQSFEQRWALARSSEAYRGLRIRCGATAKALLFFAAPPLVFLQIASRYRVAARGVSWTIIAIIGLYITLSLAVSWKIGIKATDAKMRGPQQTS
jgi:hypothetical protein